MNQQKGQNDHRKYFMIKLNGGIMVPNQACDLQIASLMYPSAGIPEWYAIFNLLLSGNPKRGTQTNSADPDQKLHNVASDQDLHCLLTAIFL